MGAWETILLNLPEVAGPTQKFLGFKEKLKWTLLALVVFFLLGLIPLFGLGGNALQQFEFLSIILGAEFGSIISLGIGPIVTGSIVLQLLNGSGIVKFDLTTHEGKRRFQGVQKLLSIFFIIFEAVIFVVMGGLAPPAEFQGTALFAQLRLLLIFQLFLGALILLFMDEVVSKWGFGSGISLFIAAGVSKSIFTRAFSWIKSPNNPDAYIGAIPELVRSLTIGDATTAGLMLAALLTTVAVFVMAVYLQAMKIEIPLSFGRVKGYGIRWPLNFIYTSNIPVILVAALLANIQLWARLLQNAGRPWLGSFAGNTPVSGIVEWIASQNIVGSIIRGSLTGNDIVHAVVYIIFFIIGSVVFSWFWMQTAGMDARSVASQMSSSGLQIPGFRKDERILDRLLDRYIKPLTILGGVSIGILAAVADLTGALGNGTGILLTVMIVYRLYEDIAKHHMMDMHPMMRKFMQ
ncbi:preprotein translocase subunit SecY [Candidatus Woesearchaeota archaeon]|nr:preprotein translocase subunit SecY [Candidatus Woesearchaeota archaeon]